MRFSIRTIMRSCIPHRPHDRLRGCAGVAAFLGNYLREKGKNAATKEDIARITAEVEGAKAKIASEVEQARARLSEELERIKADLAARTHFSKFRYEREMKLYEEIWPKLSELRSAAFTIRFGLYSRIVGEKLADTEAPPALLKAATSVCVRCRRRDSTRAIVIVEPRKQRIYA